MAVVMEGKAVYYAERWLGLFGLKRGKEKGSNCNKKGQDEGSVYRNGIFAGKVRGSYS